MEYDEITEIESWEQLKKIRFDSDRHFKLVSDINLEENPGVQIHKFRGILDGNGHKIKNIHSDYGETMPSLIHKNEGIIKNLHFTGIDIRADEDTVGGICIHNHGEIINCSVEGNLESESQVGGICLYSTGKIVGCEFEGTINSNDSQAGGIMEENHDGLVENCHTSGQIEAEGFVGGLIADNDGKVESCSSDATISNSKKFANYLGGLIGVNHCQVFESYFYGDINKERTAEGKEALLAGKNTHTIKKCYAVSDRYPLIGKENGISRHTECKQNLNQIKTALVAVKI